MNRPARTLACLALAVLPAAAPALAQEPPNPPSQRVYEKLSREHATCVAFFVATKKCLDATKQQYDAGKLVSIGGTAVTRGKEWTQKAGLPIQTFDNLVKSEIQAMSSVIGGDCNNSMRLMEAHAGACKTLIETPDVRTKGLLEEEAKSQGISR